MYKAIIIIFLTSMQALAQETHKLIFKEDTLQYQVQNPKASKQIIMIHGLGDANSSYDKLCEQLKNDDVSIVRMDLAGCGNNNQVIIPFVDYPELIKNLIEVQPIKTKTFLLGHSMGGLVALLTVNKYKTMKLDGVITIEPSLTVADKNFFKFIQEPPLGIGVDKFIKPNPNDKNYILTYRKNLNVANAGVLKENAKTIYDNFDNYQHIILDSGLKFYYVYGLKSSEIQERAKLGNYQNITVKSFENAEHWVHIDACDTFYTYLKTIIK
jgi:pimeloyl-ACP methyl ester carboxylesterase